VCVCVCGVCVWCVCVCVCLCDVMRMREACSDTCCLSLSHTQHLLSQCGEGGGEGRERERERKRGGGKEGVIRNGIPQGGFECLSQRQPWQHRSVHLGNTARYTLATPLGTPWQHRSVHLGNTARYTLATPLGTSWVRATAPVNLTLARTVPRPRAPLLPGAFFLSAETSCEVVPVEDAAVAAFAGRRTAREGAGGDAVAKVHAWQGMPSVVSWTAQAVGACRAWLPVRPFYLGTERDHVCEEKWRPSYRCILIKK
jgi:hypothetical protein